MLGKRVVSPLTSRPVLLLPDTCSTACFPLDATELPLFWRRRLQGVRLTEKERRDLEYKEQVYRLAVERKKQLGELGCCAAHQGDISLSMGTMDRSLLAAYLVAYGVWDRTRLPASGFGCICLPWTARHCAAMYCLYCLQMSWRLMTTTTCPLRMTTPRRGGHKSTRC